MKSREWLCLSGQVVIQQVVEKSCLQAGQKDLRGEASTLAQPIGARKFDERRRTYEKRGTPINDAVIDM